MFPQRNGESTRGFDPQKRKIYLSTDLKSLQISLLEIINKHISFLTTDNQPKKICSWCTPRDGRGQKRGRETAVLGSFQAPLPAGSQRRALLFSQIPYTRQVCGQNAELGPIIQDRDEPVPLRRSIEKYSWVTNSSALQPFLPYGTLHHRFKFISQVQFFLHRIKRQTHPGGVLHCLAIMVLTGGKLTGFTLSGRCITGP